MFAAWRDGDRPVTCLVPQGVAREQVAAFVGAGAVATHGNLTVRTIPFLAQDDYDRLLWSCDVNFVRGEDSWVRAQWAGRPFIWHIYPQDENLHHVKLRAFLQTYAGNLDSLIKFSLRWNGADEPAAWSTSWTSLQAEFPAITERNVEWQTLMLANGDLVSNLLDFARSLR